MIDFSSITAITVPQGNIQKIIRKNDNIILWRKPRLPKEYQEVQWVESDGKCYFISDFTINNLDKFTVYYTCCLPTDSNHMFGATEASATNVTAPRFLHRHGCLVFNRNTTDGNILSDVFSEDNAFHDYKIKCEHLGNLTVERDGKNVLTDTFYNCKVFDRFGIFCNNYNKSPTTYLAVKGSRLAELRFVDDTTGQDVFNPVPCYRKADNTIGMYDLVANKFYTNEYTGSFSKGPNIY